MTEFIDQWPVPIAVAVLLGVMFVFTPSNTRFPTPPVPPWARRLADTEMGFFALFGLPVIVLGVPAAIVIAFHPIVGALAVLLHRWIPERVVWWSAIALVVLVVGPIWFRFRRAWEDLSRAVHERNKAE